MPYWQSKVHKYRLNIAYDNRKKLKILYSANAKAFVELEEVKYCSVHLGTYFCIICGLFGFLIKSFIGLFKDKMELN